MLTFILASAATALTIKFSYVLPVAGKKISVVVKEWYAELTKDIYKSDKDELEANGFKPSYHNEFIFSLNASGYDKDEINVWHGGGGMVWTLYAPKQYYGWCRISITIPVGDIAKFGCRYWLLKLAELNLTEAKRLDTFSSKMVCLALQCKEVEVPITTTTTEASSNVESRVIVNGCYASTK